MLVFHKSMDKNSVTIAAIAFFFLSCYFNYKSKPKSFAINRQYHSLSPDASLTRFINAGHNRAMADFLWVHTLMESDLDHYKNGDLGSWIYLRLREIVIFDKKFWEAYYYGSEYLMIVKNDLHGAQDLLEKGLKIYPDDFGLNFKMGYLLAIELRKPQEAYPFFYKVRNDPHRPLIFDSLLSKLAFSNLSPEDTMGLIRESLKKHSPDSPIYQRLNLQLYSIQAQIDLDCLNEERKGCNLVDLDGNPYVQAKDGWTAKRKLLDMRLHYHSEKKKSPQL